jgi:CheY-like chemotaxis protein
MLSVSPASPGKIGRQRRGVRELTAAVLALTVDLETRDLLELAVAEGFGLRCAATPSEAGAILMQEPPGLVLVDLDLPGGGAAFLRGFRHGPHRDIPYVAVTATNDPMLAVSIDAPVFYKPDLDGIVAAVSRLFWPEARR